MDINSLLAQILGMSGGMGDGQMGMPQHGGLGSSIGGGALQGISNGSGALGGALGGLGNFLAKPTYAIGQGAGQGAGAGAAAGGGKAGMGGAPGIAGIAASGLKQSGLLPKPISSGLSGAATGAQLGSLGGPVGTGIGAGVGGLAGLFGGKGGGQNPKAQSISVGNIPLGGF